MLGYSGFVTDLGHMRSYNTVLSAVCGMCVNRDGGKSPVCAVILEVHEFVFVETEPVEAKRLPSSVIQAVHECLYIDSSLSS